MNRLCCRIAVFAWMTLAVGTLAHAQTQVTFRDSSKKDRPVTPASGTIQSEAPDKIVLKPNIGPAKPIPAADIIDVVYEVKPELRPEYRKASTAEATASKAGTPAAAKRAALHEAVTEYAKLAPKLAGLPEVERHVRYKIASLSATAAGEDKAEMKKAADLLEQFKKANAGGWQIVSAVSTLSQLYMDLGSFDKAAGAFEDLKKLPGLTDETKADIDLKISTCLLRGGKHKEAADLLGKILAVMPKTNPKYKELNMTLITCKANTPEKFKEAVGDLRKMIAAGKEPSEIALAYNTLGDCYMMNNMPKDAAYEYLYVDLIYNGDKAQHVKAVTQLVQAFKEMKQADRSKEYAEKLDKLTKQ